MSAAGAPASSSAGAAGNGQAGDGGQDAAQQQSPKVQQTGPDLASLVIQFDGLTEGQESLRQLLSRIGGGDGDEGVDGDFDLADFEGLDADEYEQPTAVDFDGEVDPEQLVAQLDQATGEAVQEAMAPVVQHVQQELAEAREQIAEQRRETQMRDLAEEFPELQDPEMARATFEQAGALATVLGQPALAAEPQFLRIVRMASKTAEASNAEPREDPAPAVLEGGGGPGGGGRRADPADQILNAKTKRGASVLNF
jgi:hypothetical protein